MQVDNPLDLSMPAGERELKADHEIEIAGKDSELASWRKVFQHAYSLVGNEAEAEDLTQETFVELFRAQAAGIPVHWLSAWMRTVTKRLAYRIGPVDTKTSRSMESVDSEQMKMIIGMTPLGRIGRPDDIGSVVTFPASDDARWVTGVNTLVSGGSKD